MKRINITQRNNWEDKIKQQGFVYYKDYYNEDAAYEFTAAQVDDIETATNEIFDMCLKVVEHVIDNNLWKEFYSGAICGADQMVVERRHDVVLRQDGPRL